MEIVRIEARLHHFLFYILADRHDRHVGEDFPFDVEPVEVGHETLGAATSTMIDEVAP